MRLLQELLAGSDNKMLAVVYGGRFQPFHKGHAAVYHSLCTLFGKDKVWIASSNKVNMSSKKGDLSPLTFDERKEIMIRMFGIDPEHIIKCKNPTFSPVEVLELYKGPAICVMAVGKKDVNRYNESDFFAAYPTADGKPLPFDKAKDKMEDANAKPKMYYLPMTDKANMSGTKARGILSKLNAESPMPARKAAFKQIFGSYDEVVYELLISKLAQVDE